MSTEQKTDFAKVRHAHTVAVFSNGNVEKWQEYYKIQDEYNKKYGG